MRVQKTPHSKPVKAFLPIPAHLPASSRSPRTKKAIRQDRHVTFPLQNTVQTHLKRKANVKPMLHFVSAFCLTLSDPQTLSTPLYIRLSRLSGFILSLLHFVLPPTIGSSSGSSNATMSIIGTLPKADAIVKIKAANG